MEQLKVEMVKRAREIGDTGTAEVHRKLVEGFLTQLQRWMTPAAVESFTADDLRAAYVGFVTRYMALEQFEFTAAGDELMAFFQTRNYPRPMAASRVPTDPKVVSIFGKS